MEVCHLEVLLQYMKRVINKLIYTEGRGRAFVRVGRDYLHVYLITTGTLHIKCDYHIVKVQK